MFLRDTFLIKESNYYKILGKQSCCPKVFYLHVRSWDSKADNEQLF